MSTNEPGDSRIEGREDSDAAGRDAPSAAIEASAGEPAAGVGVAPGARGRRSTATALFALAIIAVAGVVIYRNMPDELLHPSKLIADPASATTPATADPVAPAVPDAPDPAEARTSLVLIRGAGEGGSPVVALGRPYGPETFDAIRGTVQQLLYRELIRQAVLIAARDELALATRDELLDDAKPSEGEGEVVEASSLFRQERARALFRRGKGDGAETLLLVELGARPDRVGYEEELVSRAEELARTDFVGLLKKLGLEGEPNKVRDEAPLPDGVEEKLTGLGLVENFAAVRALHEAIRADGESPERLGALARGYAQLGALTGHHWSASHRAFDARALLYAERLAAREPKSARALRDRAFVRTMLGLDYLAIADLDAARKLDEATANPAPPPDWVDVIDARLKYDVERLADHKGPHARLAAYLKMMALEFPRDSRAGVNAARAALEVAPDCDRAYDVICENGSLGDGHQMTVLAPQLFEALFPAKLKALGDAPAAVREVLDNPPDELAVVQALDDAGKPEADSGELSWGVLAHLARETRFTHIWRRLHFMTKVWVAPADDYWDEVQDLVAKHRYRPFLEFLGDSAGGAESFTRFADRLDLSDIEITQHRMTSDMLLMGHPASRFIWGVVLGNASPSARELCAIITAEGNNNRKHGQLLRHVSPHCPFGMATLVEYDWESAQGEVANWEKEAGDSPALLGALARKYFELEQYDEAERRLKRLMEISPDHWAHQKLADCYEAKGDHDRWRSTLDEYLTNTKVTGLEHARVRVQIAYSLMAKGEWGEAREYAEDAAETWAAWAMLCAGTVNEHLGDWERAELWFRRTSERYPHDSWSEWYRFCMRTGRGDLADARALAEAVVSAAADRPGVVTPETVGYFRWLNGEPDKAVGPLEAGYRDSPDSLNAAALMLLVDELGDAKRRGEMLDILINALRDQAPKTAALGELFRDSLADGGETPLDLAAVDEILESIPLELRGNTEFIVGKFLLNRGRIDDARPHLQICADSHKSFAWTRAIAATILRGLKQSPSP